MTAKPNRVEHDFIPIKGSKKYFRRAHPRAPVELVISHGGDVATVHELTREEVRAMCRDLCAYEFGFPPME